MLSCVMFWKMVVVPECMAVMPGKIPGAGGTQYVGPIRGTRNWCLNMIGGAMSQQSPGNFPGKLPGDFLRTPTMLRAALLLLLA